MIEIQGVATDRNDVFPYSGMRILGFIQLVNGALIFLLGVGDLTNTMVHYEEDTKMYGSDFDKITKLTLASSALWCGIWFAMTGSLGTCISRARAHTLQFFKVAFLILNVLCAAFFGPVCAVLNGMIAIARHALSSDDFQWLLTLVICFLSILEVAIAVTTASVTCCCSPLRGTQVHVMINQNQNQNQGHGEAGAPPHDRLDNSFQESQASRHSQDEPKVEDGSRRPREARASIESREAAPHKFDGFSDSNPTHGSYDKLKKWALPQW